MRIEDDSERIEMELVRTNERKKEKTVFICIVKKGGNMARERE